ncbi:MAG TPA: DUF2142 domain-containing protein [Halomicronema sp.]
MKNNLFSLKLPENILVIISLFFGVLFLLITPPFQAEAEYQHFYRSFQISQGEILAQKKITDCYGHQFQTYLPQTLCVGGMLPKSLVKTAKQTSQLQIEYHPEKKQKLSHIIAQTTIPLNPKDRVFVRFPNSAIYAPISYLPQAIGITFGRFFSLPPVILLYFGRITNLIIWISCVFFAIKIIPIGKNWLLLLSLMPMSLFQAASLSADAITNGLSFLLISLFLNLAFSAKKTIQKNDIFLIIILSILLSLSKLGSYFPLLFLFFLIPQIKFTTAKKYWATFSLILLLNAATVIFWYSLVKHLNVSTLNLRVANVSTTGQLIYILNHPFQYLYINLKTFFTYGKDYFEQFIGRLGWIDTALPTPHLLSYAILLIATATGSHHPSILISLPKKFLLAIIVIINSIFIATMLYLSWMPVGSQIIQGIQGRYFIPISPLFLLLFYNQKNNTFFKIPLKFLSSYIIFSCTITVALLLKRYYLQ